MDKEIIQTDEEFILHYVKIFSSNIEQKVANTCQNIFIKQRAENNEQRVEITTQAKFY